ncbi:MAG: hypothetical protein E7458_06535 [Ruminococcaceae bacterium]|nr:hypothetical protein [Oscillospiraceae bacterium]
MTYEELRVSMLHGFNTFDTYSVLSHVLMPEGFAIKVGFKHRVDQSVLRNSLIGRFGEQEEHIKPGMRTVDGAYTELELEYRGARLSVRSAATEHDQVILVEPLNDECRKLVLYMECGFLWNFPGAAYVREDCVEGIAENGTKIRAYLTNSDTRELHLGSMGAVRVSDINEPAAISTGLARSVAEVREIIEAARVRAEESTKSYGKLSEAYSAMRTGYAWNTIYEPENCRLCSPVSRIWNINWGGYVLFDWDTFFCALMAAPESREIAYANAFGILHEVTDHGFIPNFGGSAGYKSFDRSQPPVGSMTFRELYRRFGERWILEESFDTLLSWNRWFEKARMQADGTLCWGSNYEESPFDRFDSGNHQAAMYESGLDNSPMYDDIPYDESTGLMKMADVGLTGLYCMDCEALADIARILGRPERDEIEARGRRADAGMQTLWDEEFGFFCNRNEVTGELSHRIGPTNFYAAFCPSVTAEQNERVCRHYFNPEEFHGEFVIPTIARNDPAYPDQMYWRGRIWAPTNFLAYLAFRRMGAKEVCADLAKRSEALFLQEWRAHGHIHENYSGDDGWGCPNPRSDKFYHWGGLLSLIALIEEGYVPAPEQPLE